MGPDYMEGLISKMRAIHNPVTSFKRGKAQRPSSRQPSPGAPTGGPDRKLPGLHLFSGGATSPSLLVNRRPSLPILVFLAALAVGLLLLLPGGPAQAQEAGPIMYAENGRGEVRVFTSTDPEGTNPTRDIDWDVTGIDADDFMIERDGNGNGRLTFRESPDFEDPTDRAHPATDFNGDGDTDDPGEGIQDADTPDNFYQITVRATEQTASGQLRALSTERRITVQVTNVNEDGTVEIEWRQPQAGVAIRAFLTDPDGTPEPLTTGDNPGWVWSVSKVTNPDPRTETHWETINGDTPSASGVAGTATISLYTPVAGTSPDTTDVGKMLRAMVTYTTGTGDAVQQGTALAVSEFPVRAEPTGTTNRPSLDVVPDEIDDLPEDTPVDMHVGGRVSATDDDNDDVGKLTYTLDDDADATNAIDPDSDAAYFAIDKATGRITVAQPLDFDPITDNLNGPEYTMRVRVTDPNGDIDELTTLTINVIDANDSPVATGAAELRVNEMMDGGDYTGAPGLLVDMPATDDLALYTATDDDEIHEIDWALEGVDARFFLRTDTEITNQNSIRLQFRLEPESDFGPPNYEEPNDANGDNVYKVIVVATDEDGGRHERPVTVFVDNVYEPGELELSTEAPLVDEKIDPIVGKEITAAVVDPDEGEAIVTWQWLHQMLPAADPPTYDAILGATSNTYTPVEADLGRYLRVVATYTDTTSCVDDPDTAHDERVQLTGAGAPKTPVEEQTDGARVEPCAAAETGRLYLVTKTTELAVRPEETEAPDAGPPQAPVFNENPASREVAENALEDDYVGAPIVASAAGGVTYSIPDRTDDDDYFVIDSGTGQISVNADGAAAGALNYEEKPSYTLTVRATATASDLWSEAQVNIRLINLNEPPEFEEPSAPNEDTEISYAENRTAVVYDYQAPDLDAPDPDRDDNIRWSVVGTDAADFTINGGKLRFRNPPDYEVPTDRVHARDLNSDGDTDDPGETDDAGNRMYQITVRATEKYAIGGGPSRFADLHVMVTVTDDGEPGTVMLDLLEPEVGTPIMATATDPDDGQPAGESYRWYRSKVSNIDRHNIDLGDDTPPTGGAQWTLAEGDGDASATYTPDDADEGEYLLVRVTYGDNSYYGITAYRVRADIADEDNSAPGYGEGKRRQNGG